MLKTNRREIIVGLAGLCAARAGFAKDAPDLLTAADVHVDGYPTVQAVKWIGQRLKEETAGRLTIP